LRSNEEINATNIELFKIFLPIKAGLEKTFDFINALAKEKYKYPENSFLTNKPKYLSHLKSNIFSIANSQLQPLYDELKLPRSNQKILLINRLEHTIDRLGEIAWRIVKNNHRLISYIAGHLQSKKVRKKELMGAGKEGALRAIEKFEANRNIRFATYATPWIKAKIKKEKISLAKTSKPIYNEIDSLPEPESAPQTDAEDILKQQKLLDRLKRIWKSLNKEEKRLLDIIRMEGQKDCPTLEELGQEFGGITREAVRRRKERLLERLRDKMGA